MTTQYSVPNATRTQVLCRMKEGQQGAIYFPSDFEDLGSPEAVRAALSRLAKEGIILRLAQGIYQIPHQDEDLGIIKASAEEVAKAIAKRDGARIMPAGAYALNKLGLSTQVPMKLVYLTDGAPRLIKIGKRTILFKRAVPRKLAVKGRINQLVIQALSEIGKNNVTSEDIDKVYNALEHEDQALIATDAALAPAWIRHIIHQFLEKGNHG